MKLIWDGGVGSDVEAWFTWFLQNWWTSGPRLSLHPQLNVLTSQTPTEPQKPLFILSVFQHHRELQLELFVHQCSVVHVDVVPLIVVIVVAVALTR